MKVKQGLRGFCFGVILAAGMLALLHAESPVEAGRVGWKRVEVRQSNSWSRMYRAAVTATGLRKPSMADQLREVMNRDELAAANPFANLTASDAFDEILRAKITAFERQTLRSPSYQEEAGYDLVHYEILHLDGTMSSVLAYVELEQVVVMVLAPKGDKSQYALYRDGNLEQVSLILPEEGAALMSHRLELGIPFLSVAR